MSMSNQPSNGRRRTPEAEAFAAQLRAERAAQGLTQDELSKRSGIGKQTILRIENGQRVMDTAQLGDLCRALGISIITFVMRAEERLEQGQDAGRRERQA